MTGGLTVGVLQGVIRHAACRLAACTAELNGLDAKLGDGDMGTTLATISRALEPEIERLPNDIGESLGRVVRVIGRTSGSSLGAVMMTGLQRVARETRGRSELPWRELAGLIELALAAMQERGGARLGDKSLLDGLAAVAAALAEEPDPAAFAAAAEAAVERTIARYRDKPCRIGRARLAGERSIGEDDPGMVALIRVVEAIRTSGDASQAADRFFPVPRLKVRSQSP